MRVVVQRVSRARVLVNDRVVGEIGPGLACLVGVRAGDDDDDVEYIAGKLSGLRVFEDAEGRMNLSVRDAAGAILLVPNFTLYGDCRKGRRPSFTTAAAPEEAQALFEDLTAALRMKNIETATGSFGARMLVEICNEGPVTIILDSSRAF